MGSLRPAGDLVAASFLPERVRQTLAVVLERARRETAPVRLAVDAPGHGRLPWESMPDPATGTPLALHPLVSVFRRVPAGMPAARPGPLRIVVAIASPELGGGPLLDYEHELSAVLDAVRAARQDAAEVSVVRFATTAAIRAALDGADAHVLHLSGHGRPGRLIMEHEDGTAREVTAAQFVQEAVPPGHMPPVIALAACYTDVAGQEQGISFAEDLAAAGACAVIATRTSVSDRYATRFFARVYAELASTARTDVIRVVADARRAVQEELVRSRQPSDLRLAGLDEWSVVTVLAQSPEVTLIDPARSRPASRATADTAWAPGQFVGRRSEQRRLPAVLRSRSGAGLVLYGIGGVGKTTLADELLDRVLDQDTAWRVVRCAGTLTVDGLLTAVADKLRPELLRRQLFDGPPVVAVQTLPRVGVPWQDRLALLQQDLLSRIPVLLLLDNFEDNLGDIGGGGWVVADPSVRGLLTAWATGPARSRLVITSRYRFAMPEGADDQLHWHHVAPLSYAETRKLMWSLPSLERHTTDPAVTERIWRALGGHPRTLEYLDALLSNGKGRFPDITRRLAAAVESRLGAAGTAQLRARAWTLDAALAEDAALAADEVLLTRHLGHLGTVAGAVELLATISVFRRPVDAKRLLVHLGADAALGPANLAAVLQTLANTGLVSVDQQERAVMHRWTATELDRHWCAHDRAALVEQAHLRAAAFWRWLVDGRPQASAADVDDWEEARHHLFTVGDTVTADAVSERMCDRLDRTGAWDREHSLVHDTLRRLAPGSPRRSFWNHRLGLLAQARGDYADARARYLESLRLDKDSGDRAGQARNRHQLGTLCLEQGEYTAAEIHHRWALRLSEELGSRAGVADANHDLGVLAQVRGDYREAERRYRLALVIAEEVDSAPRMADARHRLGTLAQVRGDYSTADDLYRWSLGVFEELGHRPKTARGEHRLGTLAFERGDLAEAGRRYHRALDIFEDLGSRADVAESLHQLGVLADALGDDPEADRRYRQALHIRRELGNRAGVAAAFSRIGLLLSRTGAPQERVSCHCQAFAIRRELGVFETDVDVEALDTLYLRLGRDVFAGLASAVLNEAEMTDLMLLLRDFRETRDNE